MINVNIPILKDSNGKEIEGLSTVLRTIAFLATRQVEVIRSGPLANRPTSGAMMFYYATDTKQWYAYCNDTSVGDNGWVAFG